MRIRLRSASWKVVSALRSVLSRQHNCMVRRVSNTAGVTCLFFCFFRLLLVTPVVTAAAAAAAVQTSLVTSRPQRYSFESLLKVDHKKE